MLPVIAIAALLTASQQKPPQEELIPSFEAAFPTRPVKERVDQTLEFAGGRTAVMTVHRLTVEQDTGMYVVSYFDVPQEMFIDIEALTQPRKREAQRKALLKKFLDDLAFGMATSISGRIDQRTESGDGITERVIEFNGPLLERDKKTVAGVFYGKVILRGMRAYTVLSAAAPDEEGRKMTSRFVRSFRLTGDAAAQAKDAGR